jgi:molybdopterin biosynthesis enzyme
VIKNIIDVDEAIGKMLCHDVTRIVAGCFKGAQFNKGHIITEDDIKMLKSIGKYHVYVIELDEDEVHEDEAGLRLARAAADKGVGLRGPSESRVNLISQRKGVLKVNTDILKQVNALPDIVLSTLHRNTVVEENQMIAATKIIPLVIKEKILQEAEKIMKESPVVQVVPFHKKKVSIVVTGKEILDNKIRDGFTPVLAVKMQAFDAQILATEFVADDERDIAEAILKQAASGSEIIMVTGGMSVDPDDRTPMGVKKAGVEIIKYGSPVMPGAMFLLGYLGEIAVLGVPACSMYARVTVLDLIIPRIMAGQKLSKDDIEALAHGGLCRSCEVCHFPNCTFGMVI